MKSSARSFVNHVLPLLKEKREIHRVRESKFPNFT